ncbi:hypothetical protein OKW35_009093 [Paraburkholderia sp. MM5477-R1]
MIVGDDCPRFRFIRARSSWSLYFNPRKRFAADKLAEGTKLDAQFGRKRERTRRGEWLHHGACAAMQGNPVLLGAGNPFFGLAQARVAARIFL